MASSLFWFAIPAACSYAVGWFMRAVDVPIDPIPMMVLGSSLFLAAFLGMSWRSAMRVGLDVLPPPMDALKGGLLLATSCAGLMLLAGLMPDSLHLAAGVVFAAAVEEVVFRQQLPGLLAYRMRSGVARRLAAPALSQGAFVAAHVSVPGSPWVLGSPGLLMLFASGYFYLLLYRATASLWLVIALHALLNTMRLEGEAMWWGGHWAWIALTSACVLLLASGACGDWPHRE